MVKNVGIRLSCMAVLLIATFVPSPANAQQLCNSYAEAVRQSMVAFPGAEPQLSFADNNIFVYSSKMLLSLHRKNGHAYALEGDTLFRFLEEDMTYVVRHPVTGHLFFTEEGFRGRVTLYEQIPKDNGKFKIEKVKLGDLKYAINHPVFSPDGNIMVFSSDEGVGMGGFDLWYSTFNGEQWSQPVNLGQQVNGPGDEVSPFVYDNYLFFSSRSRTAGDSIYSIYSVQLVSKDYHGDTVGMTLVGYSKPQQLPFPINSGKGDSDFIVDKVSGMTYWVSTRDGDPRLYSSEGMPEGVRMNGQVVDSNGRALPGVKVQIAWNGKRMGETTSDAKGRYEVYLQSGRSYEITFAKPSYYSETLNYLATHNTNDLFQVVSQNVCLTGLPLNRPFCYFDIYGDNADLEMSAKGRKRMDDLLRFLANNPHLSATCSLRCDRVADAGYNRWLTEHRIAVLKQYVEVRLPKAKITFENECEKGDGCFSGTGIAQFTITIN